MSVPLLIKYSQANLNSIKDVNPFELLKKLSGNHTCYFYYQEAHKSHKKLGVKIKDSEWVFIVEFGNDGIHLINPWFKKQRLLNPNEESEAIISACTLYFDDSRNPAILTYMNKGIKDIAEVSNLISKCEKLQKPIVLPENNVDKEIWVSYCEGLNELCKERRDFLYVDYAGKPIVYPDSRQGEINTIRIGLKTNSIEDTIEKVKMLLSNKYNISSIEINDDKTEITINCKGTEKVSDDDLEDVNNLLREFGFIMPTDGMLNVLKISVSCNKVPKLKILDSFDSNLLKEGILFESDSSLNYKLFNAENINRFEQIAKETFGKMASCTKNYHVKLEIDVEGDILNSIRKDIEDNPCFSVNKGFFTISSDNPKEYNMLIDNAQEILSKYGIYDEFPEFYPIYKIDAKIAKDEARQAIMLLADEKLYEFKQIAYKYEFDANSARVIRYTFKFKSAEEREDIINRFTSVYDTLTDVYKLTIKDRIGSTVIRYKKDESSSQSIDEELRLNYQGEEIKLVDGRIYNKLFRDVKDPNNIIDPNLRNKYNRFMMECPIIGTCHNRKNNYVIVKLSDEFYNEEGMEQKIKEGDMIFFPSVGTSTELRRQYEAIQRINTPGQTIKGRKIEPPVNPSLCRFLFNPIYALDTKDGIEETKDVIKRRLLDSNLNERQIEAVAKSILAKDIALIQGPPGTGKTTVIAEIIWQEIRRNPKCRILLTSQTNLAVDNALERLRQKKEIRPLRVVSDQHSLSDDMIYNIYLLDSWVEAPNELNSNNAVEMWIDNIVKRIDTNKGYEDILKEWRTCLVNKDKPIRRKFVESYKSNVNLIAATCSICGSRLFGDMYQKMYDSDKVDFDVVIMDEASKATPLEMAIPMVLGKKIIIMGDHKQLPPVLDENSIDTALRKIGKVGLADKISNLKESQFKKLFLLCQKFKPNLVSTLDTQYRMHRDIMMTINQFYMDELGDNGLICGIENVMDNPDMQVAGSRWHGISNEPFISPNIHAIWVNVVGQEEKEYTSYKNIEEVKAVKKIIDVLVSSDGFSDYLKEKKRLEDKEIAIITFYSAQKRELKKLEQNGDLDKFLDYRIDVVDRFQGMERNIVIVSTVRSNRNNSIGFAREIERINVAFSRAKTLLVVVGNKNQFALMKSYRQSMAAMQMVDIKQIDDILRNGRK